LRGKRKKQNQKKEKHATVHQGSAPNPVSSLCDLVDEFTRQLNTVSARDCSSLPPAGKSVFSLSLVRFFLFSSQEKRKK
jgi:hypothetical protein